MLTGLENLKIYQMARTLEQRVYKATKNFPIEEKFRKTSQLRGAASSVCDNIAEGYGKYSYQSKIQSFYIARGEAEEARSQIIRSGDKEFVTPEVCEGLSNDYTELIKGINGYIKFLRNQKTRKGEGVPK